MVIMVGAVTVAAEEEQLVYTVMVEMLQVLLVVGLVHRQCHR